VGRKQPEQLSEREHQVADLLALGFTNADIASRLNVSPATIASHVARILAKLGFRSRTQVAAWVVARRLADAGSSGATGSSVTGDAE
jgi:DNA-binding NarL/FixJ family response regulator